MHFAKMFRSLTLACWSVALLDMTEINSYGAERTPATNTWPSDPAAGWSEVAAARGRGTTIYATLLGSPSRDVRNAGARHALGIFQRGNNIMDQLLHINHLAFSNAKRGR